MAIAFHLTPEPVWQQQAAGDHYLPEAFAAEGFIHTTIGEEALLEAGNRYYTLDDRPYVVLTIDLDALTAPVTIEDPQRIFPHIHGPIDVGAVLAVREVIRDMDGGFAGIGEATSRPSGR